MPNDASVDLDLLESVGVVFDKVLFLALLPFESASFELLASFAAAPLASVLAPRGCGRWIFPACPSVPSVSARERAFASVSCSCLVASLGSAALGRLDVHSRQLRLTYRYAQGQHTRNLNYT